VSTAKVSPAYSEHYYVTELSKDRNPLASAHSIYSCSSVLIQQFLTYALNYLLVVCFLVCTTHLKFRHCNSHLDNTLFHKQPSNYVTGQSGDDTIGATCQESGRSLKSKFCLLADTPQTCLTWIIF